MEPKEFAYFFYTTHVDYDCGGEKHKKVLFCYLNLIFHKKLCLCQSQIPNIFFIGQFNQNSGNYVQESAFVVLIKVFFIT